MEKIKYTRQDVNRCFCKVFRAGYCELEPLYSSFDAIGYNCGVYGWNWHLYTFPGSVAITSGYRSMTGAPLPDRCKKILKNAQNYKRQMYAAPHYDYEKFQAYIKRARRNFEKALQEG